MKPLNESSNLNEDVFREPQQVKGGNIILSEWTREGDPKITVGVDGRLRPLSVSAHVSAYLKGG